MMFPISSALAIMLSLSLKEMAVTALFCFMVNTVLDVRMLNMMISPESKHTATISMSGEGHIFVIFLFSRTNSLVNVLYTNNTFSLMGLTRTILSWL